MKLYPIISELADLNARQQRYIRKECLAQLQEVHPSYKWVPALPVGYAAALAIFIGWLCEGRMPLILGLAIAMAACSVLAVASLYIMDLCMRRHYTRFIESHRDEISRVV